MKPLTARRAGASAVHWRTWVGCLWLILLLSGCATQVPAPRAAGEADFWSGRLSLQIDSEPKRQFATGFELSGNATQGELKLLSPFGQTLAVAHWQAGTAQLQRGDDVYDYPDMDSLTRELTGTPLPLATLFDWLHGRPTALDGWEVDLSQHTQGRVRAQRNHPLPTASLRLVLQ